MKKKTADDDPLDREIDFSKGRPNPYFVAYHGAKFVRVIDADLAEHFPDSKSMNEALRKIVEAKAKKRISARRVAEPRTRRR